MLALVTTGLAAAGSGTASYGASTQTIYAAPDGSGSTCSQAAPCSLNGAQAAVRALVAEPFSSDVAVQLADGVYRLSAPLTFTAADSGWSGHPVVWQAAPRARPVLSGAIHVTGWSQIDASKNIWQASVPAGTNSRQVYINGAEVPIAQTTPAEQQISFASAGGGTGYTVSPSSWASNLQNQIGPVNLHNVEFVYTGVGSQWTETRCRVDSLSGSTLLMQQPCWYNATHHPTWSQATGGLPSVPAGAAPVTIENAYPFLHPGQWYLDQSANKLDYIPLPGQQMSNLDVEVPHIETILSGTGTLSNPIHDITFSGLQFCTPLG